MTIKILFKKGSHGRPFFVAGKGGAGPQMVRLGYAWRFPVSERRFKAMEGLLRYTPRGGNPLFDTLEPVITGLGMILVELSVFRHKGGVQIRAVVSGPPPMGLESCSRVHHALLPRLELAFPGQDLSVEVSSPGIDRIIKDGSEFACYIGRGVRCFRTDVSDWSGGILVAADTTQVTLKNRDGEMKLNYEVIAKAKLDYSQEVENPWQRI